MPSPASRLTHRRRARLPLVLPLREGTMSGRLTCGCPGSVLLGTDPCDAPATQEDLLCDWCRARDCPSADAFNAMQRNAQAAATAPPVEVPF